MSSETALRAAIVSFEGSSRTVDDYMALYVAVNNCLKPGIGIGWYAVEQITRGALAEARPSPQPDAR